MSPWVACEPLTLEFSEDLPIENCKSPNQSKQLKSQKVSNRSRDNIANEICRLVSDKKMEIEAISTQLGVSLSTVRRVCRTRKIGNYSVASDRIVSHSSQAPFGWAVTQGQLHKNEKEWEWVVEMHRLRSLGTSLHKIADTLTSQDVATKNGGRWFAKTVSQILTFNRPHLTSSANSRRKYGNR